MTLVAHPLGGDDFRALRLGIQPRNFLCRVLLGADADITCARRHELGRHGGYGRRDRDGNVTFEGRWLARATGFGMTGGIVIAAFSLRSR